MASVKTIDPQKLANAACYVIQFVRHQFPEQQHLLLFEFLNCIFTYTLNNYCVQLLQYSDALPSHASSLKYWLINEFKLNLMLALFVH